MVQEKMTTMEAELGELRTQLSKLREDNSLLAGRNAVLEKVLALREEQLKAVQSGYQLSAAPALPVSPPVLTMDLAPCGCITDFHPTSSGKEL